jgi:Zn-dependent peptidase ImmA (M78 family)
MPAAAFIDPKPANLQKSVVDSIAEQVAAKLGYKPGDDLLQYVERLGGVVKFDDMDTDDGSGCLEVYPGEKPAFMIRLPAFTGNFRNRFTIAHELGHYFLHSGGGKSRIRIGREGSNRMEWEANWFAGAFLLPAKEFTQDWKKHQGSIPHIVHKYQVSEAVVEIRVKNLGLA